ncbi:TPA: hypothetical protein ACN7MB_003943, partial [Klebsiella pneumoniae]
MNITEKLQWEDSITLLTRQQRVEGGQDGAANIQAKELANRTAWLKSQLESIPDYKEYTFYPTEDDPDGTISGLTGTPAGKLFRVAMQDSGNAKVIFNYYLNDDGVARFINDMMNARGINDLFTALAVTLQQLYISQQVQVSAISDTAQGIGENNETFLGAISALQVWYQRLYLSQQSQLSAAGDIAQAVEVNERALQQFYVAQQLHTALLSEVDSQLAYLGPDNQLSRLLITQQMAVALAALEGFDPADSATASPPLLDKHFVFGEPAGIIRISVNSPNGVPPNKAAGQYPTTARIDVDGKVISFYSTFEVQGDTSATFPKKNLNITFSSTADRDEDMDLKIGDIIPHDE